MPRKPGFWVTTEESLRDSRNSYGRKPQSIWITADTYRKLKKELKKYIPLSINASVSIYRERRGNWGEWYEIWEMVNGKPKILKEGWM